MDSTTTISRGRAATSRRRGDQARAKTAAHATRRARIAEDTINSRSASCRSPPWAHTPQLTRRHNDQKKGAQRGERHMTHAPDAAPGPHLVVVRQVATHDGLHTLVVGVSAKPALRLHGRRRVPCTSARRGVSSTRRQAQTRRHEALRRALATRTMAMVGRHQAPAQHGKARQTTLHVCGA
jgi:hypothetical protein